MPGLALESRIRGCLIGSAIGAELGFARLVSQEWAAVKQPIELFDLELKPVFDYQEQTGRVHERKVTPLIGLGVRAYMTAGVLPFARFDVIDDNSHFYRMTGQGLVAHD